MANAQHSSASAEHGTPSPIIESARVVLGGIDLDPASNATFNKLVRAEKYFGERQNGFTKPWRGRVFLNPPGGYCDDKGRRVIKVKDQGFMYPSGKKADSNHSAMCWWWFKMAKEWAEQDMYGMYIAFSIELFQRAQMYKRKEFPDLVLPTDFSYCIPSDRLSFNAQQGKQLVEGRSPTHANAIIFLHPRKLMGTRGTELGRLKKLFKQEFSKHGEVVIR